MDERLGAREPPASEAGMRVGAVAAQALGDPGADSGGCESFCLRFGDESLGESDAGRGGEDACAVPSHERDDPDVQGSLMTGSTEDAALDADPHARIRKGCTSLLGAVHCAGQGLVQVDRLLVHAGSSLASDDFDVFEAETTTRLLDGGELVMAGCSNCNV